TLSDYNIQKENTLYFLFEISPSTDNILFVNKSVDQSATGYTGSGDSWDNALPELADALQWANDNKNLWTDDNLLKIYTDVGTNVARYRLAEQDDFEKLTTDRDKSFLIIKNVQLYGGFYSFNGITGLNHERVTPNLIEGFLANGTILSGDLNGDDNPEDF